MQWGMSERRSVAVLSILVVLGVAWGGLYIVRTSFLFEGTRVFCLWDDAMISMRYARNLALGEGLAWNPGGERVQGITNLGVSLGMAGLHLAPVGPYKVSLLFQLLNLLALAACVVLVWRLALRLFDGNRWIATASAATTVLCAPLQIWSLQGSDAGAVCLWLLIALSVLAGSGRDAWPRRLFWILGAGVLIRPDTSVFVLVFLATSLGYPGARWRRLLTGGSILACVWIGLMLFGQLYYGDPLPNTFYLKATGSPRGLMLRSGLAQLATWLPGLAPSLALAAVTAVQRRRDRRVGLAAGLVAMALAYHVWVGGDWLPEYGTRFIAPVLPLLSMLACAGAWMLMERRPGLRQLSAGAAHAPYLLVALGAALLVAPGRARAEWLDPRAPTMLRVENWVNLQHAEYLREHTHPSTTIALHWGGVPAYFSGRPAIDVLGRSDRHVAKLTVPRFAPGHSKWDWDYVLETRRPDIFLRVSRKLDRRSDFRARYLEAHTAGGLSFFVRRDALDQLTDEDLELVDLVTQQRKTKGEWERGGRASAVPGD